MADQAYVQALAMRMRTALDLFPRDRLPLSLCRFPLGACGDTCLLLGTYLADRGAVGFLYVAGERGTWEAGNWTTHAWLQRNGLIVDITADQFPDAPNGVIVSNESTWHRGFFAPPGTRSPFLCQTAPGLNELRSLYAELRSDLFD